ncbi:hypothetical protein CEP51_009932 [Fusarium floridanum]|uniref:2EXR domain-containing protein n=1 Tax=Fusarium floridanum TaxID=1325733 RepID=A0A428RG08_9HYPO|nr:hypothetical protein CEP51_009932 [Fusarium floridanum]
MSQSKLDSFPKFPRLANELQDLVWEWSIKDRPPAAHFAKLGHHLLVSRNPNGEKGSIWTYTMIEDLAWCEPPQELREIRPQPPELHIDVLLRTCKKSRHVAMRHRNSWGPEGTLQLYDPRDKGRANILDFSRDFDIKPPRVYRRWLHEEYMPPRIYDLPCRKVDNSRDLVILGPEWIGAAHELQTTLVQTHYEWSIPVQRVPYLALTYTTRFHEFLDSQLTLMTRFLRLRPDVLYILINPEEFDDDYTVLTTKFERNSVKRRRAALETPFPKRKGAEDLVARAPTRFWYGEREYYELTWDEMEYKMMTSERWRQLARAIDKARHLETDTCDGCHALDCNKRSYTFPAIWKVMSWKGPGQERPSENDKYSELEKTLEEHHDPKFDKSPENNEDPELDNSSENNEDPEPDNSSGNNGDVAPYANDNNIYITSMPYPDDWWLSQLPPTCLLDPWDHELDKSSENKKDSE